MITGMTGRRVARAVSAALLAFGLAGSVTLAGCSGQGATANCDGTQSCTVTFERRSDHAKIDILGLTISLESVNENSVTLNVGGKQITVDKGTSTTIGNLTVTVDKVTETEVTIKATRT